MLYAGIRERYDAGVAQVQAIGITSTVSSALASEEATEARPTFFETDATRFLEEESLQEELFGPASILVACGTSEDLLRVAESIEGSLTATIHGTDEDLLAHRSLVKALEARVGRLIVNGYPTGVEVSPAMQHGGPYPATTDARFTSVGTAAISRFARPICYQGFPQALLPRELQDANELGILRLVNGEPTRDALEP
jgi:NADP-dependent aldehyde dehydrogenase